MAAADGIVLSDFAADARRRGLSIASESALFVALQLAEALRASPIRVGSDAIRLTDDGAVEVPASGAKDEPGALASVAAVCESLLQPVPAPVRGLLDRVRKGDVTRLDGLCAELEALLVPLNRGAARRVLGRVVREHRKSAAAPVAGAPRASSANEPRDPASGAAATNATPAASSAIDTAPDAVPPATQPLASAARPGQSAVDTEPDAAAGIQAMLAHPVGAAPSDEGRVSHESLANPRIPPPPRLGSLGDLPGATGGGDPEPEAYRREKPAATSAQDTVIEGTVATSRGGREVLGEEPSDRRRGSGVVIAVAIGSLVVALLVLAAALMNR